MLPLVIAPLEHREASIAAAIHGVQHAAYLQEAQLLGIGDFAPLRRRVADVQRSEQWVLGAMAADALVGLVAVERQPASTVCIASLAVRPEAQRNGVGSALLRAVLGRFAGRAFVVSTAAANSPALALYARFGFAEVERFAVEDGLELVRLHRPSSSPSVERTACAAPSAPGAAAQVER